MGSKQRWALLLVCLSVGTASIDTSILNVALPTLSKSVGASNSQLQWIVDGYTLLFASCLLTAGSLGDRYGRRRLHVVGLSLFGAASTVAALSTSPDTLIMCRSVMGIGGACISPASLSLLSNVFPGQRERAKAMSIWAAVASGGVAVGPVVGGVLLEHFSWGSVFLVNVPIVVFIIAASPWALPESKNPESTFLDPLGVVLSFTGLTSFLYATIEGAHRGWTTIGIVAPGTVSIVLLGAFVIWELHTPRPMLDLKLFADARFTGATAIGTIALFIGAGTMFLLGQMLQFGYGFSPLESGVRMAPMAAIMAGLAIFSDRWIRRWGSRTVISVGLTLSTISCLLWLTVDSASRFALLLVIMCVFGLGQGLVFGPCMVAAMGAAPREKSGAASGTLNTLRQTGFALGIAILGSVLSSSFARGIRRRGDGLGLNAVQLDEAAHSTGDAFELATKLGGTSGDALTDAARAAFVHAGVVMMVVCASVAFGGLLIAQRYIPAGRSSSDTTHGELAAH